MNRIAHWFARCSLTLCLPLAALASEPIEIGFLWHMHQPQYRPGENVLQTDASGAFSFSVTDVHNQRSGPYTTWPRNAVQAGLSLPNLGAQVSFSGSLIQNLNTLEAAGVNGGQWNQWEGAYQQAAQWQTQAGNPRLDLVNFGFNHPLMPLLDERDIRMQLRLQKRMHERTWGPAVPFSKGIFPPETAFSSRIIPALVAEGIEWSIFDSIHLERATQDYPHTNASNLYAPNRADQINPPLPANEWVQLNNLWAPSRVAAPFAYRPHHVQHVDPATGQIDSIIAVPGARYEGNEDGRGGFGALQYEQVMDQYRHLNTDPDRPMFVLLHHDGDNFGGGSESYYHGNFQNMVNWAQGNANYNVTTIQDYLDRFPVPTSDVVHIESGSWAGADNGDPEFKKWLGDPGADGWSPDRNSWAVLTAAKNRVFTADDIAPATNLDNILGATGSSTERAWHYLMAAESSDYWYWDGTEVWDSNVTRGSNLAVQQADQVIQAYQGTETTAPTVFLPQRESYNPGGFEFGGSPEPSDFEVWTYAYDTSGLSDVTLKYRIDEDGFNPLSSIENETYAGGSEVGEWVSIPMNASDVEPPASILAPTYRAHRYGAMIEGHTDVLIDYYIEATDQLGNLAQTDIQHVYVGMADSTLGGVIINPDPAMAGESVTVMYDPSGGPLAGANEVYLHYGFNDWEIPGGTDPLMSWDAALEQWTLAVPVDSNASQFDVVFNDGGGTWDNNQGQDWHFAVEGSQSPVFEMDGVLDAAAQSVTHQGNQSIYFAREGDTIYLATEDAGEGNDLFLYVALEPGELVPANWAKSGQVASWDAFLADENDNGFTSWFDVSSGATAATGANGGVLEGILNLVDEFGELPSELFVALGAFETADGGELVYQLPGTLNGDANIDGMEFLRIVLTTGDFDRNGDFSCQDIDALVAAIAAGDTASHFDLNGDGVVDHGDVTAWLAEAGAAELASGNPYLVADADLNGVVDGQDFILWNDHKFTTGAGWCGGDFNADGQTDGQDFVLWNSTKFTSAVERPALVPEPVVHGLWLVLACGVFRRR
ncbi:MAG: hypothetical protein AAGF97_06225 [Planctomycetota bacterium]